MTGMEKIPLAQFQWNPVENCERKRALSWPDLAFELRPNKAGYSVVQTEFSAKFGQVRKLLQKNFLAGKPKLIAVDPG